MGEFNNLFIFFVVFSLAMALQIFLTGWQTKRFFKRVMEIRKGGRTSVGLSGGRYGRKVYAVLVVDDEGKIIHAEELSGITIFSDLKTVIELENKNIQDLVDESNSFLTKKRVIKAFRNAAHELLKDPNSEEVTTEGKSVKSFSIKSKSDNRKQG